MARVIAIANQKGGVAKTTTTHTLGNAFISMGKRVLFIDADPQGNLSTACGFDGDELAKKGQTLAHVLSDETTINDAKVGTNPALVSSNQLLQVVIDALVRSDEPPTRLRAFLKPVLGHFDYILIDCGPSITQATLNAFGAADQVLIPTELDDYSLKGIVSLYETINQVTVNHNPRLRVLGILPTKFKGKYKAEREHLASLKHYFGINVRVFNPIPMTGWMNNQVSKIKSIVGARPTSVAAQNYMQLAREIDATVDAIPGIDVNVGRPTSTPETV